MNPRDIAASYDRIAQRWASDAFDPSNGIRQHERALTFVSQPGMALDVGCGGSGRIIDLLLDHGFAVEGLDLSSEMLKLAARRHPHVLFHCADVCTWVPSKSYQFISGWDSIWHVPLDRQELVLNKLCTTLAPGGVLIFTAGGVYHPDERHDETMGVPMYHATLGIPRIVSVLTSSGCMLRHLEFDQYPQVHVYFIAQRV